MQTDHVPSRLTPDVELLGRTSDVNTDWKGLTANGKPTSRKGDYTSVIDWAQRCLALDGDWVTKVGIYTWNTTVSGYKVCESKCPQDGSTVVWQGAQVQTTLSFDGSSTASWSNTNDKSGEIRMAYEAN